MLLPMRREKATQTPEWLYFTVGLSCGAFSVAEMLTAAQVLTLMGYPGRDGLIRSSIFRLKSVELKSLTRPHPRLTPNTRSFGPIIVDKQIGAERIIVVDGRHRYWDALDFGWTHLPAWVGDEAITALRL